MQAGVCVKQKRFKYEADRITAVCDVKTVDLRSTETSLGEKSRFNSGALRKAHVGDKTVEPFERKKTRHLRKIRPLESMTLRSIPYIEALLSHACLGRALQSSRGRSLTERHQNKN